MDKPQIEPSSLPLSPEAVGMRYLSGSGIRSNLSVGHRSAAGSLPCALCSFGSSAWKKRSSQPWVDAGTELILRLMETPYPEQLLLILPKDVDHQQEEMVVIHPVERDSRGWTMDVSPGRAISFLVEHVHDLGTD